MTQSKPPLAGLLRWLSSLEYNAVRRIESPTIFTTCVRDDGRPLRGVLLAPDLVMTRQKNFYQLKDNGSASLILHSDVARQYDISVLRLRYKELQDQWKEQHQRDPV